MAITFRQTMEKFIPWARDPQSRTKRSISQEEIDDAFSKLFSVVFGR